MLAYSTFSGTRYHVEVCMTFNGRTACKSVSARSENEAIRSGKENACADIASGVTDTMRCEQADPQSVKKIANKAE